MRAVRGAGGGAGERLAREHAARAALHQRLEAHGAGRQVLDADGRLPRAHVRERAHRVHRELHLYDTMEQPLYCTDSQTSEYVNTALEYYYK